MIPLDPTASEIQGCLSYPAVSSVLDNIDIVDIFRPSKDVPAAVRDTQKKEGIKVIWMQGHLKQRGRAHGKGKGLKWSATGACWQRTSGCSEGRLNYPVWNNGWMSIDRILERVRPVLEELESKERITTMVGIDRDAGIIRIYGEGSEYIRRASSGLEEVLELAYTAAEHHPYWAVLYHAAEISKTALEKWESDLTADQISEMSWRCDEIKMALDRLSGK
ncbi:MAG TPA: CoA-binding protein [Nitrososphaera sp.]